MDILSIEDYNFSGLPLKSLLNEEQLWKVILYTIEIRPFIAEIKNMMTFKVYINNPNIKDFLNVNKKYKKCELLPNNRDLSNEIQCHIIRGIPHTLNNIHILALHSVFCYKCGDYLNNGYLKAFDDSGNLITKKCPEIYCKCNKSSILVPIINERIKNMKNHFLRFAINIKCYNYKDYKNYQIRTLYNIKTQV